MWDDLQREIELRLEQTFDGQALRIPFQDRKLAASARSRLSYIFRIIYGKDKIRFRLLPAESSGANLYVWRNVQKLEQPTPGKKQPLRRGRHAKKKPHELTTE